MTSGRFDRRTVLKGAGAAGLALAAPNISRAEGSIVRLAFNQILTGEADVEPALKQSKKDYYAAIVRGGFYEHRGLEIPVPVEEL